MLHIFVQLWKQTETEQMQAQLVSPSISQKEVK